MDTCRRRSGCSAAVEGSGIRDGDVEHPSEFAGFLDVAAGVRHSTSRHCRWSCLLGLLEFAGNVESAWKLMGL